LSSAAGGGEGRALKLLPGDAGGNRELGEGTAGETMGGRTSDKEVHLELPSGKLT